jgi:hypothetical protein
MQSGIRRQERTEACHPWATNLCNLFAIHSKLKFGPNNSRARRAAIENLQSTFGLSSTDFDNADAFGSYCFWIPPNEFQNHTLSIKSALLP